MRRRRRRKRGKRRGRRKRGAVFPRGEGATDTNSMQISSDYQRAPIGWRVFRERVFRQRAFQSRVWPMACISDSVASNPCISTPWLHRLPFRHLLLFILSNVFHVFGILICGFLRLPYISLSFLKISVDFLRWFPKNPKHYLKNLKLSDHIRGAHVTAAQ